MTYPKLKFFLPLLAIPLIQLLSYEKESVSKLSNIDTIELLETAAVNFDQGFDQEYRTEIIEPELPIEPANSIRVMEFPENPAMVVRPRSGKIRGVCTDPFDQGGERIVVYAFKKDVFNPDEVIVGQNRPLDLFKDAVASVEVQEDGSYTLTAVKNGEYELHFIRYDDIDGDGTLEPIGYLELELMASLNDLGLAIDAKANLSMDVTIIGASAF